MSCVCVDNPCCVHISPALDGLKSHAGLTSYTTLKVWWYTPVCGWCREERLDAGLEEDGLLGGFLWETGIDPMLLVNLDGSRGNSSSSSSSYGSSRGSPVVLVLAVVIVLWLVVVLLVVVVVQVVAVQHMWEGRDPVWINSCPSVPDQHAPSLSPHVLPHSSPHHFPYMQLLASILWNPMTSYWRHVRHGHSPTSIHLYNSTATWIV